MKEYKKYIVINLLAAFIYICSSEPEGNVYQSIAHLEPLVEIERRLIKVAREYLDDEKFKLKSLQGFAKSVRESLELSKDDPIKYLGNPVNSYLLIKRFTSGWKDLADLLSINDEKANDIKTILKANEVFLPTYDIDMVGATAAMFRLQDTYNITAREIAEGEISGIKKTKHKLTAQQCLEIAEMAHDSRRYVHMASWLKEAERIMNDPTLKDRRGNITRLQINEFLAWMNYLSNDMKEALKYTNLVLKEDSTYEPAIKNKEFYEFYEQENVEKWLTPEQWDYKEELQNEILFYKSRYAKGCNERKKKLIAVKDVNNLVCFYKNNKPRLILKPLKVTRMHDNPDVLVFHEMITEEVAEKIRDVANPRLRPSEVIDPIIQKHVTASYRVSKNVFFDDAFEEELEISRKLRPLVEDATDLNDDFSEQLQVNNYGLGGQYEFHVDFGDPGSPLDKHEHGNRIATLLIYLSDVERGGDTVFTRLGLSLKPKLGDAAFWHNLYKNGSGIYATEHASCPVVSGSKWVANKWFHTLGNEFTRKCSLNKNE
ncbi:prolyl 4-hydroxylase subunit alpha-1 isoform X2 [Hydra vulgaris]|uniref:prolyl 4-hydroxylase subunit alpha-1 isoform X2 n=1 Tax=Hydra vulgaris TaxID=6087 RepID=UPI001F5EC7F4|nr:prolyl 4-hydroxylase subunit alpha-1 isoform X2 [Hydra vulgaris]